MPMTGGEDWLEWSWSIAWERGWPELREVLQSAKAMASRGMVEGEALDVFEFGGQPAVMSPGGARLGRGNKGPYMPWRFTSQGLVFLVADRAEPHRTLPSVVVRADGRACLTVPAEKLWDRAGNLLASLGGRVQRERLTRVDPCLDLPGVAIGPIMEAYEAGAFVTRAKAHQINRGNRGTTVYIGRSPQLRVYDKLAELNAKGDVVKHALTAYHRWSGVEPRAATRAEFQLDRLTLKSRGIDTVRDYFDKRADLVAYLANDWVRFTTERPDPTHTTRARTLPMWSMIQRGFADWVGRPIGVPLDPLPRESYETSLLIKSALGLVMTAAVRRGKTFGTEGDLLRFAAVELKTILRDTDWRARMMRKAVEFVDEGGAEGVYAVRSGQH
ncbi:MAG: hypothetical protein AAF750_02875 [Planctomycetota bacterium]